MRKVLVISYYWPPAGGGGVQRTLKFCKHLRDFGWDPYVVTADTIKHVSQDMSLIKDEEQVTVTHARDYLSGLLYKSSTKELSSDSVSFTTGYESGKRFANYKRSILTFCRLNFLIPDSKIFWYKAGLDACRKVLADQQIDLIYSTSPPYTAQLIGLSLSRLGLPWVVDFRDPWVENVYYNVTYRNPITVYLNRMLEQRVLSSANRILTVGDKLRERLEYKSGKRVSVIENGYDSTDFQLSIEKSSKFIIGYYGSLNKFQFPEVFATVLKELESLHPEVYQDMELHIAGNISRMIIDKMCSIFSNEKVFYLGYLRHDILTEQISKEQLLLQFIHEQQDNEIIVGSKLYEYLHTGNPILCIGNTHSDGARLVRKTEAGLTSGFSDRTSMQDFVLDCYYKWKDGCLNSGKRDLQQYERKILTGQLADIFNEAVVKNKSKNTIL